MPYFPLETMKDETAKKTNDAHAMRLIDAIAEALAGHLETEDAIELEFSKLCLKFPQVAAQLKAAFDLGRQMGELETAVSTQAPTPAPAPLPAPEPDIDFELPALFGIDVLHQHEDEEPDLVAVLDKEIDASEAWRYIRAARDDDRSYPPLFFDSNVGDVTVTVIFTLKGGEDQNERRTVEFPRFTACSAIASLFGLNESDLEAAFAPEHVAALYVEERENDQRVSENLAAGTLKPRTFH